MPEIAEPAKSYLSVHYELRSAKQVERRMLIDALHTLGEDGFRISDYQYTGMGSIYFVDFVLFHKLLNITDMWSVEYDADIRRRVQFNKPFNFVKIFIEDIGDIIPRLSLRKRHLLWIDYDSVISRKAAMDIVLACSRLTPGSIFLVTVDVEPPIRNGNPEEWKGYFDDELGQYVPPDTAFAKSKLPRANIDVISNIISSATAPRAVEFLPLFSFIYRDGHQMLTMGGMFVAQEDKKRLLESRVLRAPYVRTDFAMEPCEIRVPRLTRKERIFLEGSMPCAQGWRPRGFELNEDDIRAYKEIYRFFPVYAELFL